MRCFKVTRTSDTVMVLLIPHKDGSGYSFVNLTRGHICPCKFDSVKDAIEDMKKNEKVISFEEVCYDYGN